MKIRDHATAILITLLPNLQTAKLVDFSSSHSPVLEVKSEIASKSKLRPTVTHPLCNVSNVHLDYFKDDNENKDRSFGDRNTSAVSAVLTRQ